MDPREYVDHPNVRAFLRAIRLGEGTSDEDGYRRIVGGDLFTSFADHPRKRVWIERYKVWSSAAGAYQFLGSTWDEMRGKYALPDFSQASQDIAAVGLLIRRKALSAVLDGRIEEAVNLCRLEWASLPGSPYGQRTEAMERVMAEYRKHGGAFAPVVADAEPEQPAEQPPAPIVESHPVIVNTPKDKPMNPWLITALPALVEAIPGLIRNFGKGEVTERNAQAAERVLGIVQAATGASNAQGAVEAVASDPAARAAATEALDREGWFVITEAGGGGIEGARAFSLAARGPFWELPAFWISLLLLLPLYAVVAAVLFQDGWADTIRVQVVTAILGVVGIIGAFWLGSSFSSQRKDSALIGK